MINRYFASKRKFWQHVLLILALSALPASAAEPWAVLPPTPAPIHSERSGQANANGISIHYAVCGQGSPVILLHGRPANTDYWGNKIKALAPHHTVIVMDSRGHGRSTRDSRPYGYDLMAGLWMARAIHVAVRLGLPDLLANRPRKLSDLALATDSDEQTRASHNLCCDEITYNRPSGCANA